MSKRRVTKNNTKADDTPVKIESPRTRSVLPELDVGLVIIIASVLIFIVGSYAVLFSAFLPLSGIPVVDAIATDTHYKYFAFLIIPMGTYFVIANWVGWQYYQNS